MSQSASVRWAPFFGPDLWPGCEFSHISRLLKRGSVGMSEQHGGAQSEGWLKREITVGNILTSILLLTALVSGYVNLKRDTAEARSDALQAKSLANQALTKADAVGIALTNGLHGVKTSFGIRIKPLRENQSDIAKQLAVLIEAQKRSEANSRDRDERMERTFRDWQIRERTKP